jgi:pantoate kinase
MLLISTHYWQKMEQKVSLVNKNISTAYAPAHITGFFKIYPDGSTGAGVNPKKGAVTKVELENGTPGLEIIINKNLTEGQVSKNVVDEFIEINHSLSEKFIRIKHELTYPVGYGMGMSGAGAFSLALALNQVSNSKLSYDDCMFVAMRSEIKAGTGLGDVIAQKYHGLMIGLPPFPSRNVEVINSSKKYVACGFFAPISTGKIIRDSSWKEKINSVGSECMAELEKDKSYKKFIELCRYFSLETGLASPEVRKVMGKLPESSMAMLGQSVFVLTDKEQEAHSLLKPYCERIEVSEISTKGAHVID